jgi:hypothetical protein
MRGCGCTWLLLHVAIVARGYDGRKKADVSAKAALAAHCGAVGEHKAMSQAPDSVTRGSG